MAGNRQQKKEKKNKGRLENHKMDVMQKKKKDQSNYPQSYEEKGHLFRGLSSPPKPPPQRPHFRSSTL